VERVIPEVLAAVCISALDVWGVHDTGKDDKLVQIFRRSLLPLSSEPKSESYLLFYRKDKHAKFLRKFGNYLPSDKGISFQNMALFVRGISRYIP